jgi:hypothetical protein
MNETKPQDVPPDDTPNQGPNLVVIYALIVVALLGAIVIAAFIVFPFYKHR